MHTKRIEISCSIQKMISNVERYQITFVMWPVNQLNSSKNIIIF